jgi:hypothetical protein
MVAARTLWAIAIFTLCRAAAAAQPASQPARPDSVIRILSDPSASICCIHGGGVFVAELASPGAPAVTVAFEDGRSQHTAHARVLRVDSGSSLALLASVRPVDLTPVGEAAAAAQMNVSPQRLRRLLREPIVLVRAAAIPADRIAESLDVDVLLLGFGPGERQVQLLIDGDDGPRKVLATRRGDDRYAAAIVPRPLRIGPQRVGVNVTYPAGSIRASAEDQAIRLDQQPFQLSDLSSIERDNGTVRLVTRDGRRISGSRLSMAAIRADLGGYFIEIDTFKARIIAIAPLPNRVASVTLKANVMQGAIVLAQQSVQIPVFDPAELTVHARGMGAIAGIDDDSEFRVPRSELHPADGSDQPSPDHAWARLRIVNNSSRKIAAVRVEVACERGDQIIRRSVDATMAETPLGPGQAIGLHVDFGRPAATQPATPVRVHARIIDVEYW